MYYIVVLVLKTEIILKCIANGRMVDVQHKGCRGIVPKYDEFGEHPETIVEYELD